MDKELKEGYIYDFISNEIIKATPEEVDAVQVFSKRLVEDFNYQKEQIQTRPQIRVRRRPSEEDENKGYPVDIAIFNNNKKDYNDLFMIVECKQKRRQDGLKQLKIYMNLSPTKIGIWFNGKEHLYLLKNIDDDNNIQYLEIPTIPKRGQRIEDIGKYKREDLEPAKNLWNLLRKQKKNFYLYSRNMSLKKNNILRFIQMSLIQIILPHDFIILFIIKLLKE